MILEQFATCIATAAATPRISQLTSRQLSLLARMELRREDPSPWGQAAWDFKELSEASGIPRPSLTRALVALSELGYVEVRTSKRDARKRRVSLTEAGAIAIRSLAEVQPLAA